MPECSSIRADVKKCFPLSARAAPFQRNAEITFTSQSRTHKRNTERSTTFVNLHNEVSSIQPEDVNKDCYGNTEDTGCWRAGLDGEVVVGSDKKAAHKGNDYCLFDACKN